MRTGFQLLATERPMPKRHVFSSIIKRNAMLNVVSLSPQNEMRVVERLVGQIRATWPEVVHDPEDRIDLLVGVRAMSDVDLLLALDFCRSARTAG